MIVGTCMIELSIIGVLSLKEKRQVVKSIINRISSRFNVSVAEVGAQEKWQYAVLGVSCVSNSSSHANSILSNVVNFIEKDGRIDLVDYSIELL